VVARIACWKLELLVITLFLSGVRLNTWPVMVHHVFAAFVQDSVRTVSKEITQRNCIYQLSFLDSRSSKKCRDKTFIGVSAVRRVI